jgi:anti-sigma regulatory factor (Ser/Thr protein kinase)
MPFNALPAEEFLNRESELDYLQGLSALKGNALGGNVLLEGARGAGKTELLKQLYRLLFWQDHAVPFYYSFQTANLKGGYFARDYFYHFVRQYIAFLRKEPALAVNAAEPLRRLMPSIVSLGLDWLQDAMEDMDAYLKNHEIYWQMVAAISVPALAAQKGSQPVVVMLDDFDAAASLYETNRGDVPGIASLFGNSMKHRFCPHVITGAADTIAAIFSDQALIGMTEKMRLSPLPEELSIRLFRTHLVNLRVPCPPSWPLKFLGILKGNPLFVRNLAKAAWKMQKKELSEKDLIECYAYDVSDGETAFYWSSILGRYVKNTGQRKAVLKFLVTALENRNSVNGKGRLSADGLYDTETEAVLDALLVPGMVQDSAFRDAIACLYMKEVEGLNGHAARERIIAKYIARSEESVFEFVIPMRSNAELVVAKAVEQIGINMDLNEEFLNYLQLALIEVCINAIEHSGSYEKKVYLKFIAKPDLLEIIVENDGRFFSLDERKDIPVEEKLRMGMKRGWGFKLVHSIMDQVKIERVNDRTRVIMKKNIKREEVDS